MVLVQGNAQSAWTNGLYYFHPSCVQELVDKAVAKGAVTPTSRKTKTREEFQQLREQILETGDPFV